MRMRKECSAVCFITSAAEILLRVTNSVAYKYSDDARGREQVYAHWWKVDIIYSRLRALQTTRTANKSDCTCYCPVPQCVHSGALSRSPTSIVPFLTGKWRMLASFFGIVKIRYHYPCSCHSAGTFETYWSILECDCHVQSVVIWRLTYKHCQLLK